MDDTSAAPVPASRGQPRLPRELGLWSAVAVVVGSTIGSGIFRTPASVTNRLPGPLPLLAVWVAGGLLALCGALTLAEVAGAFPDTGGIFVFIHKAYGRLAAFLFGWSELTIIRAASLGAVSTTFAEYFMRVLGYNPAIEPNATYVHYIAALAIVVTATFNYVGMRTGSFVQNVTTLAKYLGLVFTVAPFGLALVSVLWAYDGWADLTFVSGEVKDPRRNLPRALIIGTCAVIGIYLLANVAYLSVLPVEQVRTSPLVAADVAARIAGAAGVAFVSITVMLSTFGTLNGSILTSPRVFFAMADERLLFKKMASI